jgi:hypothetical protein
MPNGPAYLRAIGAELSRRSEDMGQIWPGESGTLHAIARGGASGRRVPEVLIEHLELPC